MQRFRFGWLMLVAPMALSAAACGSTERRKGSDEATNGSAGRDAGKPSTGGTTAEGIGGRGGSQNAGNSAGAGSDAGGAGGAGAVSEGGAGGEGGASVVVENCTAPSSLAILGDYVEPNGDQFWLRDSGNALTLTRVTPGKPSAAKLPSLWQVVSACAEPPALVLRASTGAFTRLDYLQGATSLTVCLAANTAATAEQAEAIVPPGRTNTIDAGCNGGPWTRVVKGGN